MPRFGSCQRGAGLFDDAYHKAGVTRRPARQCREAPARESGFELITVKPIAQQSLNHRRRAVPEPVRMEVEHDASVSSTSLTRLRDNGSRCCTMPST